MATSDTEDIISIVEHSLAVEHLWMTDDEKDNLRRVGRGEITYDDLIALYVTEGKSIATAHTSRDSHPDDYRCDPDDPCVYAGTDILTNRFKLKDFNELSTLERAISGASIAKLETEPIGGNYDLEHLKATHKAIFCEIYEWAGQIRQGFISKGETLFCAAEFIKPYSAELFAKLHRENLLRNLAKDVFVSRMSFYGAEINALHPFREGNGRTQRVFMDQLARQAGWELNFRSIDPDVLCDAFKAAMTDEHQLADLLAQSVSRY